MILVWDIEKESSVMLTFGLPPSCNAKPKRALALLLLLASVPNEQTSVKQHIYLWISCIQANK